MHEDLKEVVVKEPDYRTRQHVVYYIVGAIEILLLFRFVFKMSGANPASGFVAFIYSFSDFLVFPFRAIFGNTTAPGAETTAVFEPATLVALVVFVIIAWGIAKLIAIMAGRSDDVE